MPPRGYPTLVRAHVRGNTLDPSVADMLRAYFTARPDIRACEAAEHGYDPLTDPARYLAQELAEPEHASVRAAGPVTTNTLAMWERQEDEEHADDPHTVAKDSPTATDVHVDVPLGSDQPKRKRKKGDPAEPEITVVKADQDQRLVYGIVLEPDVEDSQGDIVSKEDVELAAHRYVYQNIRPDIIGDQHAKAAPETVRPVESFIAPCDFELGGQQVRKGSWVLVGKIDDDRLWEQVKKGEKGAWSVGGTGKRRPLR